MIELYKSIAILKPLLSDASLRLLVLRETVIDSGEHSRSREAKLSLITTSLSNLIRAQKSLDELLSSFSLDQTLAESTGITAERLTEVLGRSSSLKQSESSNVPEPMAPSIRNEGIEVSGESKEGGSPLPPMLKESKI